MADVIQMNGIIHQLLRDDSFLFENRFWDRFGQITRTDKAGCTLRRLAISLQAENHKNSVYGNKHYISTTEKERDLCINYFFHY
jgi:hypothetical protein